MKQNVAHTVHIGDKDGTLIDTIIIALGHQLVHIKDTLRDLYLFFEKDVPQDVIDLYDSEVRETLYQIGVENTINIGIGKMSAAEYIGRLESISQKPTVTFLHQQPPPL